MVVLFKLQGSLLIFSGDSKSVFRWKPPENHDRKQTNSERQEFGRFVSRVCVRLIFCHQPQSTSTSSRYWLRLKKIDAVILYDSLSKVIKGL